MIPGTGFLFNFGGRGQKTGQGAETVVDKIKRGVAQSLHGGRVIKHGLKKVDKGGLMVEDGICGESDLEQGSNFGVKGHNWQIIRCLHVPGQRTT